MEGVKSVGIFSSSFNPPTQAHVSMCREAARQLHLDEIVLVITAKNADKDIFGATIAQRMDMMSAITPTEMFGGPDTGVSIRVVQCPNPRFIDILEHVGADYPPNSRLVFIMGYDTVVRLFDPKYYRDSSLSAAMAALFSRAGVVAFDREGLAGVDGAGDELVRLLGHEDVVPHANKITVLGSTPEMRAVSSSQIRDLIQAGHLEQAAEMLPPSIIDYIQKTGLYK